MKTLFYNGTIYTMEDAYPTVEAVAVEDGKIIELYETTPEHWQGNLFDLKGHTMLPGFIDGHSHFLGCANSLSQCDLSHAKNFQELIDTMKSFIQDRQIESGKWVVGINYDHNFLEEKRHPDCDVLDQISTDHPILLVHISNHMGIVNRLGFKLQNITKEVKDIPGGRYGRFPNGELNGYMEENVFIEFQKAVSNFDLEMMKKDIVRAQDLYARYGITTIQDGMVTKEVYDLLKMFASEDLLYMDVVGYVDLEHQRNLYRDHPEEHQYQHHFRLGGYKIFLDGSPQGKTAWLKEPYLHSQDRGYPIHTDETVYGYIKASLEDRAQLLAHCNGDAAAKQYVDQFLKVMQDTGIQETIRPVMIHAQLVAKEEVDRMKKIPMIPSFFVAHTYYWGDIHIENLGMARASRISPVHDAIQANLPYTFHQDTPVLVPDMMKTVACAVNRITRNGVELSKEQRISVMDALKGITVYAAYQYHEEDRKGSIQKGKLANFTILEKDPLKVEPQELETIAVSQTIVEGKVVYQKI